MPDFQTNPLSRTRTRARAACGLAALLLAAGPIAASSQPAGAPQGLALVIGTSTYTSQPAVPACRGAAEAVAGALRGLGFKVTERQDPTRGEFDATLAGFGRTRAAAPEAPAVVYVCGLATEWNNRAFLVPSTAVLARDTDALTQGILARNAADAAARGATGPSLVLLDLTARPGGPALSPAGFAAAAESATAARAALVAASGTAANLPVTPMAAALRAELAGPVVELTSLVSALRARLPESARLAVVAPDGPRHLAGGPPPVVAAPPAPPPAPPAAAAAPPSASGAAPPAPSSPALEEAGLIEVQRRRIQASLGVLGHYNGRVDGQFGPETRAAIRRYQASTGADVSGRLTPSEIAALLGHAR
jgi:hypothetical protein